MMRKEAIAQRTLKSMKVISYVALVALVMCGLLQCGYKVGREHTIREARPYTMEGTQYIQYGEEVHDYGESVCVTITPVECSVQQVVRGVCCVYYRETQHTHNTTATRQSNVKKILISISFLISF